MSLTLEAQQLLAPEITNLEIGNPTEFSPVQLNEFMTFYVPFLKKVYEIRSAYCKTCETTDDAFMERCTRDDCDY